MTHESGARARWREGDVLAMEQPAPHAQAAPGWEPEERMDDAPQHWSAAEDGDHMCTHRAVAQPCLGARWRPQALPEERRVDVGQLRA